MSSLHVLDFLVIIFRSLSSKSLVLSLFDTLGDAYMNSL